MYYRVLLSYLRPPGVDLESSRSPAPLENSDVLATEELEERRREMEADREFQEWMAGA